MKSYKPPSALLFLSLLFFLSTATVSYARHDMTDQLEYIGNPYQEYYKTPNKTYARNIWDMIEFKGKIYLGAGNSSNKGPAVSPGPAAIMVYDPKTNVFSTSLKTSDDQVDRFYIFDHALYVPGHDPRESWSWGNMYKTTNGNQWIKKRTIPFAVHTYCLTTYEGKIFAGLGTAKGGGIATSNDLGDSWQFQRISNISRIYEFMQLNHKLYAFGPLCPPELSKLLTFPNGQRITQVIEYSETDEFIARHDITLKQLFPNTPLTKNDLKFKKITRPQQIGNKTIYIGATLHNDHQSLPFGLYVAESLQKNNISVRKVEIPDGRTPWDIHKSENYVYILTNKKVGEQTEVAILRSNNLQDWTEVFYFNSPQLARSFIFSKGTFYFSLGYEVEGTQTQQAETPKEQTGQIYKITLYSTQ